MIICKSEKITGCQIHELDARLLHHFTAFTEVLLLEMESEDGMCWGGEVVGEGGGEVKGGGMNRKTYPIIRLSCVQAG